MCVSIHLMLLFIERPSSTLSTLSAGFNTSHVTLYQFQKMCRIKSKSCFNTSHVTLYLKSPVRDLLSRYRFNTSHVTLYQSFRQKIKCFLVSFNTSHVTLYLIVNCYRLPSIMFQYISCYSLSFCLMYRPIFFDRFNTSHVTLYPFGHHFLF